ncbi:hypothetical protein AB4133_20570, partial [Vibrio sp. 10N.286.52.F8]|uniref:hypothetical protein n=1 Tax=Vibrio sp. 10N.286.52.F8 TaxID=3229716 RepID=UPI00354D8710
SLNNIKPMVISYMKYIKLILPCLATFMIFWGNTSNANYLAPKKIAIKAESEHIAFEQAQFKLAKQLFSKVSAETVSSCQTIADQTHCLFEDKSTISSIPIEVSHLSLHSQTCGDVLCQYQFSVDVQTWYQQLTTQLSTSLKSFDQLVSDDILSWDNFLRMEKARDELAQNKYRVMILSSIAPNQASSLLQDYHQSEVRINERISQTPVKFLTAGDLLSQQVANALTQQFVVDQDNGLPIYVESLSKQGHSHNRAVSHKTIRLKLLEPQDLSRVVQQIEFSERAIANDVIIAKEQASNTILTKINQHTFYELFLGREK